MDPNARFRACLLRRWTVAVLLAQVGCGADPRGGSGEGGGTGASGGSSSTGDGDGDGDGDGGASGSGATGSTSATTGASEGSSDSGRAEDTAATESGTSEGGLRLDVAGGGEGPPGEGGGVGCEKVDFLFLVDNSGSMTDEQNQLVAAFPDFIATIQGTLMAQDYRIIVIDTDGPLDPGNCNGNPDVVGCCAPFCAGNPLALCGGRTCPGVDPCMAVIGAGRVTSESGADCGITGGNHYIVDGQADLANAFACAARVGTGGDGREVQMQAITEGIGPLVAPGACNEGFLRDDAILVLTLISDEEDDPADGGDADPGSPGDPAGWHDAVVAAKGGDANAIVALGLLGDTDLPGAVCQPLAQEVGAEPAPRLRAFVESFSRSVVASVCSADYAPFFAEAVGKIDATCDDFVPPG